MQQAITGVEVAVRNTDCLTDSFPEPSLEGHFERPWEFTSARGYHEEIQRTIDELYARLPGYRDHASSRAYGLVRENLETLATCYETNILSVTALEVLHAHLLMLRRMCFCSAERVG